MTTEPQLVRILEISEESFGTEIHVEAIALTSDGGRYHIVFKYEALEPIVRVARASAYDALFARVFGRASHADVEAAKLASKNAASMTGRQSMPAITEVDPVFPYANDVTTQEREAALEYRDAHRQPIDPDRVARLFDARIDRDPDVTENFETETPPKR